MAPSKNYSVYNLVCPIDNQIKYIGSSEDLHRRYMGHIQCPNKSTRKWITELKEKGMHPIMNQLEAGLTKFEALDRERELVMEIQKKHGTLLNVRYLHAFTPPINYLKKDGVVSPQIKEIDKS